VTDAQVLDILRGAIEISTKLAAPILGVSLVMGIGISVLQTVTQIQEMTLTFVPKLLGIAAILVTGGHWMMRETVQWVTLLWQQIPQLAQGS
jgi:flagellar biosynthetic protein FliQ